MKCSCCGNEMKIGNVCARGGGGMYWLPEGESINLFVSNKKIEDHSGIVLVDRYSSAYRLNQSPIHRLEDSRCAIKNLADTFKYLHLFSFAGFYNTHDATVHLIAALLSEPSGYFLPIPAFPEIPFTHLDRYRSNWR